MKTLERHARRLAHKRQMLLWAAAREEFTIEDVWNAHPVSYQLVANLLLEWWREGLTLRKDRDGDFVSGRQLVTNRSFPGKAVYRWNDENIDTPPKLY